MWHTKFLVAIGPKFKVWLPQDHKLLMMTGDSYDVCCALPHNLELLNSQLSKYQCHWAVVSFSLLLASLEWPFLNTQWYMKEKTFSKLWMKQVWDRKQVNRVKKKTQKPTKSWSKMQKGTASLGHTFFAAVDWFHPVIWPESCHPVKCLKRAPEQPMILRQGHRHGSVPSSAELNPSPPSLLPSHV